MGMPELLPSNDWATAWCELYKVFSERLDQENVDLMDSVLSAVVSDAREEKEIEKQESYCPYCGGLRYEPSRIAGCPIGSHSCYTEQSELIDV